jgi:glycosyltransferase involved in cell wall biosynthesis
MSESKTIIGLPVYNGERYLGAAIESHLSQSYGDFDLVISDNGSTDATPEICANFAKADSRVKYLRSNENRGILWNHRRVMEAIQTSTRYFRWAGGDDILEPGLLKAMVEVLDASCDVEAVMPATKNIGEQDDVIGSMNKSLDAESSGVFERALKILTANYQHVVAYGLLRAPSLRAMRTGPNYVGWDPIFVWEIALRGKIFQLTEPALLRRFHRGSISRVKTVKEMRKWVEPNAQAGMNFPHWTWSYERMRSLLASPLSAQDKLRLSSLVMRSMVWQRTQLTRDVTQAVRRGLGLSDEYTF